MSVNLPEFPSIPSPNYIEVTLTDGPDLYGEQGGFVLGVAALAGNDTITAGDFDDSLVDAGDGDDQVLGSMYNGVILGGPATTRSKRVHEPGLTAGSGTT
ncbi:hypothetical protein SAMN04488012_11720 [Palleronia salina]|uniref:Uncharacterized protein n=1 Tax=Palleronia salina TaxID=313368 RepID=A0A1M6LRB3_9RHOB|nr:hypothetical protein [Palleronia salina]SHJ73612.1 hypothetical protein SAMN04488012_11720 [Palleronia salina]